MATRRPGLSILLVALLAAVAVPATLSAAGTPAESTPTAASAPLDLRALFTTPTECPVLPPPTADDLCGSCCPFCSSVPSCLGKALGTACDHQGGRCRARTGCALYNCCDCA